MGNGRFGAYVHGHGIYVTLPKELDPLEVTLDEAIGLLKDKMEAEAKRHIKKFPEEPDLEIMNGRYGPYIAYQGNNYKIPAGIEPADLSLASCMDLIKLQAEKISTRKKRTPKAAAKEEKVRPRRPPRRRNRPGRRRPNRRQPESKEAGKIYL